MRSRIACLVIVVTALTGCSSTPEKAPTLAQVAAFPKEFQSGAKAVASSIQQHGENPSEFHAVAEGPINGTLIFHLWHQSAFTPENRNPALVGNPGGKCRDVTFDIATNKVLSTALWQ